MVLRLVAGANLDLQFGPLRTAERLLVSIR